MTSTSTPEFTVRSLRAVVMAAIVALHALCAWAQSSPHVEIAGDVKVVSTVDVATLSASSSADIVVFEQARTVQGVSEPSIVRGVRLVSLIERAGLASSDRNAWKTLVVIATATDGYRAVFSWPELANTAIGDGVLLLFERDGRALDDREGRIALISTGDRRQGPRYVRNLARIEVRPLD